MAQQRIEPWTVPFELSGRTARNTADGYEHQAGTVRRRENRLRDADVAPAFPRAPSFACAPACKDHSACGSARLIEKHCRI
jgi:hypothetical protein